jgi:G:T/U-mismatch repair DNA glycosylase
MDLC